MLARFHYYEAHVRTQSIRTQEAEGWLPEAGKLAKGDCFRSAEFSIGKTGSSEIDSNGLPRSSRNAFKSTKEHKEAWLMHCILRDLHFIKI